MTMNDSNRWLWLAGLLLCTAGVSADPILTPFLIGVLLAYLGDPLVDRPERWGLSRTGRHCRIRVVQPAFAGVVASAGAYAGQAAGQAVSIGAAGSGLAAARSVAVGPDAIRVGRQLLAARSAQGGLHRASGQHHRCAGHDSEPRHRFQPGAAGLDRQSAAHPGGQFLSAARLGPHHPQAAQSAAAQAGAWWCG